MTEKMFILTSSELDGFAKEKISYILDFMKKVYDSEYVSTIDEVLSYVKEQLADWTAEYEYPSVLRASVRTVPSETVSEPAPHTVSEPKESPVGTDPDTELTGYEDFNENSENGSTGAEYTPVEETELGEGTDTSSVVESLESYEDEEHTFGGVNIVNNTTSPNWEETPEGEAENQEPKTPTIFTNTKYHGLINIASALDGK